MTQIEKSEITKNKILAAAESEFSEKGIWGARIDTIATIAGVNKRMIYEHFESKEKLYKTVLAEVYARLAEYDKASECWLHSHELQPSPKMTDNLLCLAEVCVIRKQYDKAAQYYRDTVELLKTDYNTTEGDLTDDLKARAEMYESM